MVFTNHETRNTNHGLFIVCTQTQSGGGGGSRTRVRNSPPWRAYILSPLESLDRFVGTDTTEPVQPDCVSALRSGQKPGAHPAR